MTSFRALRADEINVRAARVTEKGVQLLLYKDARCDMRILDETIGREHWQDKYYECKGNLFCSVGILIGDTWIWKDNAGSESNMEKEKGEASDAFKRACFCWGIGRELYSSPFIWVPADKANLQNRNGKPVCTETFKVSEIASDGEEITKLSIANKAGTVVYSLGARTKQKDKSELICPSCKKPVKDYTENGKIRLAAAQVAARNQKKWGLPICADCAMIQAAENGN